MGVVRTFAPYAVSAIAWIGAMAAQAAQAASAAPDAGSGPSEMVVSVTVAGLFSLGSGVLTHFVTRREWAAENSELKRRVALLESGPTRNEHSGVLERLEKIENAFRADVGVLHEKVNRVDRAVASVETETRVQSRALEQIIRHLGIQ
jgi:hypothetical protein